MEDRQYAVHTAVTIFKIHGNHDDLLLDLEIITVLQQYNTTGQGPCALYSQRGVLGRIERKSTAKCFWDITKHFFIVIVTLYNRRFLGLVSKRFSKLLFFLFGQYMSLVIFRGEELSNCKVLTVRSSLWGRCHADDGYAVQECKLVEKTLMANNREHAAKLSSLRSL